MSRHTTDNGVVGPTFLEGFTEHITNPVGLHDHEWRRRLCSPGGGKKFHIKYYGQILSAKDRIITRTEFSAALVIAVDIETRDEILLFDGCKHGYNALLCDIYTEDQIVKRIPDSLYKDKDGNIVFEVYISTYNGIDFDLEFSEEVDDKGQIELVDGSKVPFEFLKRNGFDTLLISGVNEKGETVEILSEETA